MNWDVATSGWLPALISSVLSLFGLGKNKELKKNKKNLQANIGGDNYAINADTVIFTDETLKNEKVDSSLKQKKEEINQIIKDFVNENVDTVSFNMIIHGNEDVVLDDLPYIIRQYLQKRKSLDFDIWKCKILNEKLESMLNHISAQFPEKFDECFAKLYMSSSWDCFFDEKFVEKASVCYRNNWNDKNGFSSIVENILSKLNKNNGTYIVENDCSRVLQVFWDSLDLDLKYKIAIAYYWIFRDPSRKDGYLQKKFAKEIYNELGFEEIVREMMRRELNRFSTEIEVIDFANKYQLDEGKIKLRFDDIFAKPNFDYESFKDIK